LRPSAPVPCAAGARCCLTGTGGVWLAHASGAEFLFFADACMGAAAGVDGCLLCASPAAGDTGAAERMAGAGRTAHDACTGICLRPGNAFPQCVWIGADMRG